MPTISSDSRIEQAARNNAIWCDTLCRAHGIPGEFHDAMWINRHPVPRFYSNAVTLSDQRDAAAQLAHIQTLVAWGLPGNWSVKDSFRVLDLAALGFQLLFEATWLWRAPSPTASHRTHTTTRWTWVQSASELEHWEMAWGRGAANTASNPQSRLFVPGLLAERDIAFLAAYEDEKIVAGAIANRTDEVVGLSNVFVPVADGMLFWDRCIATVQKRFPGLPIVGYERGPDLDVMQAVGFERVQELRVWTRQA